MRTPRVGEGVGPGGGGHQGGGWGLKRGLGVYNNGSGWGLAHYCSHTVPWT